MNALGPFILPIAAISYSMAFLVLGGGLLGAGVTFLISRLFGR